MLRDERITRAIRQCFNTDADEVPNVPSRLALEAMARQAILNYERSMGPGRLRAAAQAVVDTLEFSVDLSDEHTLREALLEREDVSLTRSPDVFLRLRQEAVALREALNRSEET